MYNINTRFLFRLGQKPVGLILIIFLFFLLFTPGLFAQTPLVLQKGIIEDIKIQGIQLIEKGLIYSTVQSRIGSPLSAQVVSEDIKSLFQLGYFRDIKVLLDEKSPGQFVLTYVFKEKPRIVSVLLEGNIQFDNSTLEEKLIVKTNNMLDLEKIKADKKIILEEYRKKGFLRTQVQHKITKKNDSSVALTYRIIESPRVFLTDINITGTNFFQPLDIERIMQSAEIDCFSWINDSGIFQEFKINRDLAIITQNYMQNGFIKVKLDKPKIVMHQGRDVSKISFALNIKEGDQYFTGKIDIVSDDNNPLIFADKKKEIIKKLALQPGDVYNPFKQTRDRFTINDIYLEQGYAFAIIRAIPAINTKTKIVNITYKIIRGEKTYIGRVEIQGNYETLDSVIRRELEIHDNELFNGVKLRESQRNINRLGFFEPGTGIVFNQDINKTDQVIDYNIQLKESQTGTFSASLSYAALGGFSLILSVSKKNLFGTGNTVTFSTEHQQKGKSRYDLSIINPYWLDTNFTNSYGIYSRLVKKDRITNYYKTRTYGFYYGLSYPIWKDWSTSGRFSWKEEKYKNVSLIDLENLGYNTNNKYRSMRLGLRYNTVNNPMFPSNGYEANLYGEEFGGVLGGNIEYRGFDFNTRWFKSFSEDETVVFMAKYTQSQLYQTNPAISIPLNQRYVIGGITTVRGFTPGEIKGPTSKNELPTGFNIVSRYPYEGDYSECKANPFGTGCPPDLPFKKNEKRTYYSKHLGGSMKKIINLELLFPLTREGRNIRGVVFADAGNVWSEDKMYSIVGGTKKNPWYFRKGAGLGVRLITPMGVLRFEYGIKLDKKEKESPSQFDFNISGLF